MAIELKDALIVTAATYQLGLPLDVDSRRLEMLTSALCAAEAESPRDFPFALVTDDEVDAAAVDDFAPGKLAISMN